MCARFSTSRFKPNFPASCMRALIWNCLVLHNYDRDAEKGVWGQRSDHVFRPLKSIHSTMMLHSTTISWATHEENPIAASSELSPQLCPTGFACRAGCSSTTGTCVAMACIPSTWKASRAVQDDGVTNRCTRATNIVSEPQLFHPWIEMAASKLTSESWAAINFLPAVPVSAWTQHRGHT
jgi:hypothetical protein